MNLPSNVKIDFPFAECRDCNRCDPEIVSDDSLYIDNYLLEHRIVRCRHEKSCERLVNGLNELRDKLYGGEG